ncbi:hypothetical protein DFQ03_1341 [Maribacter caenipelagi]|jgi:hypothetical protein|uniref:Uncharacterized protein n=1 Tax=Maribacter caenipelagi TaxID=1447781 RepID=A0A4R7D6R1_9FLAO|nr:hypothetical protein [Maribacter caenipelagi]TDS16853.1 hypothetical protein DFQ03_1341 [Maribacter caenipelagi]
MSRRIFRIIIAFSILLAIYLIALKDDQSKVFLIVASSITFLIFSLGIHGLIAHSLRPETKGNIIVYPILMWSLWAILFLLFIFFIIPVYCPDFLLDL